MHTGTTWAPRGETPVVRATGRRFSLNMISAISPRGQVRFMTHTGTCTATIFRDFLKRLLASSSTPVFLIVDGHAIHKAKLVRDYVAAQEGRLQLFYLPPYAPQLNPDELVWGHVKKQVSRQIPQSQDDLKFLVLSALRRLQKLPHIVAGFFRHPTCRYTIS